MRSMSLVMMLGVLGSLGAGCGSRVVRPPPFVPPPPQQACVEQWVHMPVRINFPTGGAQMDVQTRAVLEQMVVTASGRRDIRRVRVEGHTDTCGNELSNMSLSQQRAVSVAEELVAMAVPREMLETVGYGSTQPVANERCDENTELSRHQNRRVEFTFLVCH
jgi:OOP family OmpA-OmpF porin